MGRLDELRVRQLDEVLAPLSGFRARGVPPGGWVKNTRQALGMSLSQLAARVGLTKTTVANMERGEGAGAIRLASLKQLAEAMDCDLVYALVPRESLQRTIENQAKRTAQSMVARVSESMELEAQGVPVEERERQISEITDEILRNRGRDFWDV